MPTPGFSIFVCMSVRLYLCSSVCLHYAQKALTPSLCLGPQIFVGDSKPQKGCKLGEPIRGVPNPIIPPMGVQIIYFGPLGPE